MARKGYWREPGGCLIGAVLDRVVPFYCATDYAPNVAPIDAGLSGSIRLGQLLFDRASDEARSDCG